jgi:hypothetical protein
MGIFSKAKKEDELVLVFDIGSGKVGGALFWVQDSGIPKIIFSTAEPIPLEKEFNIDRFFSLTIQSLETVANRIYLAKLGAPTRIFCILSSPLHISQTRIINFKKNIPFLFTTKLADDLMQKEISLFKEEHSIKHTNSVNPNRIIETKNIKTILNGYETPKPLGQKAKELEMTIFVSMGEEQVLAKIEDALGKYFHSSRIKFSSFELASFAVTRDVYIQQENFILVDIGGEVTDLSMVKKNILRESITFPLGYNFLIRGVASGLHVTSNEADSFLSLLQDGHAEESITQKLALVLDQLKVEWLKKFQDSLANLSNDIFIPSIIYLTTDKKFADFFSRTIKAEQLSQYTLTEAKFEITFLSTQILRNFAMFKEIEVYEPNLIIDAIYINRFLNNSLP